MRGAVLAPVIAVTVVVGQLGLWLYRPEPWEVRRPPEANPDAFWDVPDNPIFSTLDTVPPGAPPAYDSPPTAFLCGDHGTVRTR